MYGPYPKMFRGHDLDRHFRREATIEKSNHFSRVRAYDLKCFKAVELSTVCGVDRSHATRAIRVLQVLGGAQLPHVAAIIESGYDEDSNIFFWTTPQLETLSEQAIISGDLTVKDFLDTLTLLVASLVHAVCSTSRLGIHHGFISPTSISRAGSAFAVTGFALSAVLSQGGRADYSRLSVHRYVAPKVLADENPDLMADLSSVSIIAQEIWDGYELAIRRLSPNGTSTSSLYSSKARDFMQFVRLLGIDRQWDEGQSTDSIASRCLQVTNSLRESLGLGLVEGGDMQGRGHAVVPVGSIDVPAVMPLLSSTVETLDRAVLADKIVLHVNHNTADAWIFNGLMHSLTRNLVFVALPYGDRDVPSGTPYDVYHARKEGDSFRLQLNARNLDQVLPDFDSATGALVSAALQDVARRGSGQRNVIVIEDGGYHYDVLQELESSSQLRLKQLIVGAVEQTAAGVMRCNDFARTKGLQYPVLSVARSLIKTRLEAYFIGQRVVEELNYLLYQFNDFLMLKGVLVVGYGIIGRNIARRLRSMGCNVSVHDIDPEVAALAAREGYPIVSDMDSTTFSKSKVVIGATGSSSFTYEMFECFLKGNASSIYLASASSKRVEFGRVIDFFEGSERRRVDATQHCPALNDVDGVELERTSVGIAYHFRYDGSRKSIVLVAGGVPVNFFRPDGMSLPYRVIDPVQAEIAMLAGHLARFPSGLESRLYLLGDSDIPGFSFDETALMRDWLDHSGLNVSDSDAGWALFGVHPLEARLRASYHPLR